MEFVKSHLKASGVFTIQNLSPQTLSVFPTESLVQNSSLKELH